jgi:hypothetical protein
LWGRSLPHRSRWCPAHNKAACIPVKIRAIGKRICPGWPFKFGTGSRNISRDLGDLIWYFRFRIYDARGGRANIRAVVERKSLIQKAIQMPTKRVQVGHTLRVTPFGAGLFRSADCGHGGHNYPKAKQYERKSWRAHLNHPPESCETTR